MSTFDEMKASPPEIARAIQAKLNAASTALNGALRILRDQEDRNEYLGGQASGLRDQAAGVAGLAEMVKRQV